MPIINLVTEIKAPIGRCFDLSRSIDLHLLSTSQTHEKAVAGVTKGLIELNEQVTWRAKHLGVYQHLTSKITAYQYPNYFVTTMQKGAFKKLVHTHSFEQKGEATLMYDHFDFEAPFGLLGKAVSRFLLYDYMTKVLETRNAVIKKAAESEEWRKLLPQ